MPYSPEMLDRIEELYLDGLAAFNRLYPRFAELPLRNSLAREFAQHGFGRRLSTLRQCMMNVFQLLPPEAAALPRAEQLTTAAINIQAFIINVFGALDNLAWIWVHERGQIDARGRRIHPLSVGLGPRCKDLRGTLSDGMQAKLENLNDWFDGVGGFRHALAHRIPLYIPPYGIAEANHAAAAAVEQRMDQARQRGDYAGFRTLLREHEALGHFHPVIQESFGERARPIFFHAQMPCDFLVVTDLADHMLGELGRRPNPKPEN
jgi:hypothetical protein